MRNNYFTKGKTLTAFLFSLLLLTYSCSKEDPGINQEENLTELSALSASKGQVQNIPFTGTLPAPCIQRCLVAGQKTYVGSIDVAISSNEDILVTYNITKPGIYLMETHTDVFSSMDQFKQEKKVSNGGASPGQFTFKSSWTKGEQKTKHTVVIPKAYYSKYLQNSRCLFIATHAALSNGETAWGGLCADTPKGVSLDNAKQFPGKNWSTYFEFCLDECKEEIDFTYAWEDQRYKGNDGDYNDLVLQADVIRTSSELKLTFLATARGASYDHIFKIRIPKQGIVDIFSPNGPRPAVTTDGNDYIITVFESTKTAQPATNKWGFVNTLMAEKCDPFAYREIVLTTNSTFSYNAAKPYIPFITCYSSGKVGVGTPFDLSIYELSGKDTWVTNDGKVLPNGILIPRDWRWPVEWQIITGPYPKFPEKGWADYFVNPSLTYDKKKCQ
ncbi:LruC domain-containing protein [Desertivirga brevis]|uniref:LruC domain-containing protein n=1 Tax=Desertivirga brevis TaxID=2810310 RepID=UPI001A95DF4F|nr:LruC domain-containing protein [Pedobacter sp. SYSU D00873]